MSYALSDLAKVTARYVNTTDRHVFLTGKAGTGKTTFLKYIVAHTHKKTVVAAPTGIAAINAEGVTLHSLLQLPFGAFIPERVPPPMIQERVTTLFNLFTNVRFNASKRQLIRELELLIIDEVSMLRADLLDCIDHMLRFLRRRRNEPFGGLQVLFIGDLLQLPPVVKDTEWQLLSQYYKSSYFFEARALQNSPPVHVELEKVFRQQDERFINLLNRFRENKQTTADVDFLNGYYQSNTGALAEKGFIHLTTHNRNADEINAQRLSALQSPALFFEAQIEGDYPEHLYPNAQRLELREGAQVMFIKNDISEEKRFFNGKIGQVSTLGDNQVTVRFESGETVEVEPHKWENNRYTLDKETNEIEQKLLGSFEQYPLKLAWAVTVHKSQGLTFEKAILDLSGAFAQGQVYVALSRLTSLEGLVLSSKLPQQGIGTSLGMEGFMATRKPLQELEENLATDYKAYVQRLITSTFDLSSLFEALYAHEKSFDKQENRSVKQQHLPWTQAMIREVVPVREVARKFLSQVQKILSQEGDADNLLSERVTKAAGYFNPILQKLSKDLLNHERNLKDKTKLKTYRKELKELDQVVFSKITDITRADLFLQFALEDKVLTRQDLKKTEVSKERKTTQKKKEKKDKTPSAEVSYNLYKEGRSLADIAIARELAHSTIEGHLSQYVAQGKISAKDLMDEEKLKNILTLINEDTTGLGEVKAKLGEEYSFGDVRMAMAHYKFLNKPASPPQEDTQNP